MRAVVLAGAAGLRLELHSRSTPKALLPIAGEPARARAAIEWPARA